MPSDSSIGDKISAVWLTKGVIAAVFSLLGIVLTAALYSSFTRQASADSRLSGAEGDIKELRAVSGQTADALKLAKQESETKLDKLVTYVQKVGDGVQALQIDVAGIKAKMEK